MLVSVPFISASGTIIVRMMRNMHEAVVSCYMNLSLTITMGLVVLIQGEDMQVLSTMTGSEWAFMVMLSFSTLGAMIFNFKALQNWEVSKLANLFFMFPIFYFAYDTFLFDVTYGTWQIIGASITTLVYITLLTMSWLEIPLSEK
mmetsp:Transcript_29965/g.21723  ORF Transcript_29965/g.21723 Transcript_29965/m.21723 type:complete len:145 (-) Transcript_29965:164-598(-)